MACPSHRIETDPTSDLSARIPRLVTTQAARHPRVRFPKPGSLSLSTVYQIFFFFHGQHRPILRRRLCISGRALRVRAQRRTRGRVVPYQKGAQRGRGLRWRGCQRSGAGQRAGRGRVAQKAARGAAVVRGGAVPARPLPLPLRRHGYRRRKFLEKSRNVQR